MEACAGIVALSDHRRSGGQGAWSGGDRWFVGDSGGACGRRWVAGHDRTDGNVLTLGAPPERPGVPHPVAWSWRMRGLETRRDRFDDGDGPGRRRLSRSATTTSPSPASAPATIRLINRRTIGDLLQHFSNLARRPSFPRCARRKQSTARFKQAHRGERQPRPPTKPAVVRTSAEVNGEHCYLASDVRGPDAPLKLLARPIRTGPVWPLAGRVVLQVEVIGPP